MNQMLKCTSIRRRPLLALAAASLAAPLRAQSNWPDKPLRIIVPFAPGGPPDVVARLIQPRLGELLGQAVVIDNRAGAGGNIGAQRNIPPQPAKPPSQPQAAPAPAPAWPRAPAPVWMPPRATAFPAR